MNKIYKVERTDEVDYWQVHTFIVVAENANEALNIHPDPDFKPPYLEDCWTKDPSVIRATEIGTTPLPLGTIIATELEYWMEQ